MTRSFDQLNFYEMLDVKPNAAPFEIRHAYNDAVQIYQPGALASYSFFTAKERRQILSLLEKAYSTLINDLTRKDYDDELIGRGEIEATDVYVPSAKKPVGIFDVNRGPAMKTAVNSSEDLKSKIEQSQAIGDILAKMELCGVDLRQIREELGVTLEHIAQETKIRLDHLRNIEDERTDRLPAAVFLKGFVKSYLKCLCLEPVDDLSGRYMNTLSPPFKK